MARDYYAILGVSAAASSVEIRRAYQRLARQYSPDVNLWQQDSTTLFEEVAEAYRVLRDPMAREVYDRRHVHASPPTSGTGAARVDTGAARVKGRRGDDLPVPVELAFQQAVTGVALDLSIERLSPCAACDASGAARGSAVATCGYCGGLGTVWTGDGVPRPESCPACAGAGTRAADACSACRGRGVAPSLGQVRVVLPPGMDSGAQIRVEREGHAGPFGGPRGDLIVIARVHDDPAFVRKGDNLYREVAIGIVPAVLGTRVAVRGIDGTADLVVPPGTQSGQVFRLRGRGMPRRSGGGRGDLYVTVRVEIPRDLDVRTQELFRELGRLLPPVATEPGVRA